MSIRCFDLECTNLGDEATVLDVVLCLLAGSTRAPLDAIAGVATCDLSSLRIVVFVFGVCPLGPLFLAAPVAVRFLLSSVVVALAAWA